MQIILSKYNGFCKGVERAVRLCKEQAKTGKKVYTLGKLIHNSSVVEELQKEGIIAIDDIKCLKKGDYVAIRSHGTTQKVIEELTKIGVNIIDATCPSVDIIHKKVKEYSDKGYHIVIIGKDDHPEIEGTKGWCDECTVIDTSADKISLPETQIGYFVVVQTTLNAQLVDKTYEKIKKIVNFYKKTVVLFNSICYTTTGRQESAKNISQKVDTCFVIGDALSSNTKALFDICKQNCAQTYLITNVSDVKSVSDTNITKLGIVAGASAPQRLVLEVINIMDQENKVDSVVIDEAQNAPVAEVATKENVVEEAKKTSKEETKEMTMAEALKRYAPKSYKEGKKVTVRIVSIDPNAGVTVAVDGLGKNDSGFIDKSEMEIDGTFNPEKYKEGDELEAIIIPKTDAKMKSINLSKKAVEVVKLEDEAVKKILDGEEFTLACTQAIKGGLIGHIGTYTIFVPASQIRVGYVKNLEDYIGKKLRLRILPAKEAEASENAEGEAPVEATKQRRPNPKRIVAGQRAILEEEKAARDEAFWEVMQVNNIIKGKVKRFAPFGAFVSIMNFDCLAHISDLSWTKIKDPSEVLEINKSYDFVVIKVDREHGKVSLGYKQLQKKPYELAAEKYHQGDIIKGKVERIKDFGAFIEIEPGIDGLVHVSEIGHKWIANANEVLNIGDEVEAKIIGFENNKITLSIKQLTEPPVKEDAPAEEVAENENAENTEAKPSRVSKFNKRAEAAEGGKEKKERRPRREKDENEEPREWVSAPSGGATFADLFKDIDMNKFDENK